MDLSMISGPIIGALIGYGTNWIAIKMLFRPIKPVKIGKYTLPFTPGIIPKRKGEIARAVGDSVGNNLFTTDDIKKMLLTEEAKKAVTEKIITSLENEIAIKEIFVGIVSEEIYANTRENLKLVLTEKIRDGLINAKVGQIIATEGAQVMRNKAKSSMIGMFITDGLIESIATPMGEEVEKYIKEHSQEKIIPIVDKEIAKIEQSSIKEAMKDFDLDKQDLEKAIKEIYENLVINYVSNLLKKLDIAKVVEDKINQMDVMELEKLILSVMKKELGAVVNLGAVIGLILGTVNIFI